MYYKPEIVVSIHSYHIVLRPATMSEWWEEIGQFQFSRKEKPVTDNDLD